MAIIVLINLPFEKIYEKTKMARMTHYAPPLSLSTIGAGLLQDNHDVTVFDLNLRENTLDKLQDHIRKVNADYVGISFVTPLFNEMVKVVDLVKATNPRITTVGGGPHCSSYPANALEHSKLDIAVVGEGDFIIRDIAAGKPLCDIKGIAYRDSNGIALNERRPFIDDLDSLPYPAYHLFDTVKYHIPRTLAKRAPVAWMESSRGCVYGCVYCNKNIFGHRFRTKSPERVMQEMIRLEKMGFREVHFTDDAFTTDINRAKKICALLMDQKINLSWALITGIRVNQVDPELLHLMKKAGCYRIFFGIESGNQQILKNIRKGITVDQVIKAVQWAKEAGIEVWGAFMVGLPGETEQTMQQTIDLAKELPLDLAKMSILIPLPATPIFEEWEKKGILKTKDWSKFTFYSPPSAIYDHPTLAWETIMRYYNKFYREFYFRPYFMLKRLMYTLKNNLIFNDIKVLLGTKWFEK